MTSGDLIAVTNLFIYLYGKLNCVEDLAQGNKTVSRAEHIVVA